VFCEAGSVVLRTCDEFCQSRGYRRGAGCVYVDVWGESGCRCE
jgi:hypothetical protein